MGYSSILLLITFVDGLMQVMYHYKGKGMGDYDFT